LAGIVAKAFADRAQRYEMFAQPRKAYILLGIEPELDCHNPQQAMAALKDAALVVMLTPFSDGSAQATTPTCCCRSRPLPRLRVLRQHRRSCPEFHRCRSPLGRRASRLEGAARAGQSAGAAGLRPESSEQVRDEMVPRERRFVSRPGQRLSGVALSLTESTGRGLQRVADVPIYFADPLARRAPACRRRVMRGADGAHECGNAGEAWSSPMGLPVRIRQGSGEAVLTARADETVPAAVFGSLQRM
jgi:NADH-quinone oxidoreductase subunit G